MLERRLQRHLVGRGVLLFVLALAVNACFGSASSPTVVVVNTLEALAPAAAEFESQLSAALDADVEFLRVGPETEDLAAAIESLIASEPDLIVTFSTPTSLATAGVVQKADIPLVFGMVTDPVGSGLVVSIETPGLNITGVSLLNVQRGVELLVNVTGARRIAILHQPSDAAAVAGLTHARRTADMLGIEAVDMPVASVSDLAGVLEGGPVEGVDAVYVVGSPFAISNIAAISDGVATWDVPAAITLPSVPLRDGFLLGVATDETDLARQMADRVVAILEGGSAGRISVGVAESVAMIDLDQARRLGIQVPDPILLEFDTILDSN